MPDATPDDVLYISPDDAPAAPRRRLLSRRRFRYPLLASLVFLVPLTNYLLWAVVGLWKVNSDFSDAPDGIEILIASNGFHSDLYLPVANDIEDWRGYLPREAFSAGELSATHVGFGWGDARFYMETPTWADMKISTAASAFLTPTETVMHVDLRRLRGVPEGWRSVKLTRSGYKRLVESVKDGFETGRPITLPGESYGSRDAFFRGAGTYHCFNTCHSWAGACLREAGVTTGLYTPLPGTPAMYLPKLSADESEREYPVFSFGAGGGYECRLPNPLAP